MILNLISFFSTKLNAPKTSQLKFLSPKLFHSNKTVNQNPKYGSGIGIITKNPKYYEYNDPSVLDDEFIGIKIKINNSDCLIGTLYKSPNEKLNINLFKQIKSNFKYYLITGDLNSKEILDLFPCSSNLNSDLSDFLVQILQTTYFTNCQT